MKSMTLGSEVRCCPICSSIDATTLIDFCYPQTDPKLLNHIGITEDESWPIVECCECQFMYSQRVLKELSYIRRYEVSTDNPATLNKITKSSYYTMLLNYWSFIAKYMFAFYGSTKLKVLDYGCGLGQFCRLVDYYGIEAYGYETNNNRVVIASQNGIHMIKKPIEAAPYNLIVAIEVIEHLPDPVSTVKQFRDLLCPINGLVFVTVPLNYRRLENIRNIGIPYPKAINPWEHLSYFTKESLRNLFFSNGFELAARLDHTKLLFKVRG